jgi:hypothetical protein
MVLFAPPGSGSIIICTDPDPSIYSWGCCADYGTLMLSKFNFIEEFSRRKKN